MVGDAPARRPAECVQVRAVAPLSRPVHVLVERALMALHRVPRAATHGQPRGERQHQHTQQARHRRQRQRVQGHAGQRLLAGRTQQVDVVAVGHQRLQEARGRTLHPAVEDERTRDDENLQRAPATRSTSG